MAPSGNSDQTEESPAVSIANSDVPIVDDDIFELHEPYDIVEEDLFDSSDEEVYDDGNPGSDAEAVFDATIAGDDGFQFEASLANEFDDNPEDQFHGNDPVSAGDATVANVDDDFDYQHESDEYDASAEDEGNDPDAINPESSDENASDNNEPSLSDEYDASGEDESDELYDNDSDARASMEVDVISESSKKGVSHKLLSLLHYCLTSSHMLLKNHILVRFGSHDWKFLSNVIPASAVTGEETTDFHIRIENWILPICHSGHFKRIVWLKNSWCTQIDVGKYNFIVGEKDELIKVDCPIDYFISKGSYCTTGDLLNASPVELQVHNADTDELDPLQFLSSADAPNFVLNIDLDFFSTSNSFLGIYENANCYAQLTEIFRYESNPKDYVATAERRKQQLEALWSIFAHLETKRDFTHLAPPDPGHVSDETLTRIRNLAKALAKHYREKDIHWLVIFEAGCTTQNGELPHHNSTPEQLLEYFGFFERFLQRLPTQPIAIIVDCKSDDKGCSKDQVAYIQTEVLRILQEKFGCLLKNTYNLMNISPSS